MTDVPDGFVNVSDELMREVHLLSEEQKRNGETMDRIWAIVRLLPASGVQRILQFETRLSELEARVERLEQRLLGKPS